MNFQNLGKIEDFQFYLDTAFARAKKKADATVVRKGNNVQKSRYKEKLRIETTHGYINSRFQKILNSFPSLKQLPEFYHELVKCTLDYVELKKALGSLNGAISLLNSLQSRHVRMISRCEDLEKIFVYRKQYYGRVSSVVKSISRSLRIIDSARRIMKEYPNVKTSYFSVCLCGFPNVGKTTLLSKLTGSTPEINSYSFTTKGINVGYSDKIQFLDTPGTLARFDKMNNIERIAHLAVKYASDVIVFVFDLTEPYPVNDQHRLLNALKKTEKPMLLYLSKTDILEKEKVSGFSSRFEVFTSPDELKKRIDEFREKREKEGKDI